MISSDDVTPDDAVAVNAEGRSVDRKKEIPAQKSPAKARNATLNFKNPSTIYRLNPGFYKLLSEHKDDLPKIHLKLYQAQIQSPQELEGIPEFIGKALRHFPDNLVLNFVNADLAMMTGRPLSGIIGFKRLLGIVEKMDSPANALFILQQLLDQFPLDVILLEKKAEALGQLGRAEEGAQALMVAAKHYEDEKLFKPATQCLFKGLSLFPGIWALSFNLGHCFLGMPSAKYALEGLNRMLSKSPQNPALYLTRGLLNSRLGDDENADLDFTLSVELCERDVTALTVLQELAGSDAPHELLSRIRTKIKVLDPGGARTQAALEAIRPAVKTSGPTTSSPAERATASAKTSSASSYAGGRPAPGPIEIEEKPESTHSTAIEPPAGAGWGSKLLVLLLVLGMAGAAPVYLHYQGIANGEKVQKDLTLLARVLATARMLGKPHSASDFRLLVVQGLIPAVPVDPWGHEYRYDPLRERVVSSGPDGILDLPMAGQVSTGNEPNDDRMIVSADPSGRLLLATRAEDHDRIIEVVVPSSESIVSTSVTGRVLSIDQNPDAGTLLTLENEAGKIEVLIRPQDETVPFRLLDFADPRAIRSGRFFDRSGSKILLVVGLSDVPGSNEILVHDRTTQETVSWAAGLTKVGEARVLQSTGNIIFNASIKGIVRVARIAAPGDKPKVLCNVGPPQDNGCLSPDGRHIAFIQAQDRVHGKLHILDIENQQRILTVENVMVGSAPVWSPWGERLAILTEDDYGFAAMIVLRSVPDLRLRIKVAGLSSCAGSWSARISSTASSQSDDEDDDEDDEDDEDADVNGEDDEDADVNGEDDEDDEDADVNGENNSDDSKMESENSLTVDDGTNNKSDGINDGGSLPDEGTSPGTGGKRAPN